jgi:hypothetical protein
LHRCDKGISAPRHICDVTGASGSVPKRFAQGGEVDPEIGLLHYDVRPHPGHELAAANDLPRAFDKCDQEVEGAPAERKRAITNCELAPRGLQAVGAEPDVPGRLICVPGQADSAHGPLWSSGLAGLFCIERAEAIGKGGRARQEFGPGDARAVYLDFSRAMLASREPDLRGGTIRFKDSHA